MNAGLQPVETKAAETTAPEASAAERSAAVELDDDFFEKSGPLPTAFDEGRRYPRFYYRARIEAAIHPLGGSGQPPTPCSMLARDLSRGGINLVHNEQIYPGQRIDLVLTDGSPRSVEVIWCRRIAHHCYSVGCRFIKSDEAAGDNPGAPTDGASSP